MMGSYLSLDYVRSELNISDPFTKLLGRKLVENTSRGMRLMFIQRVKNDSNLTYVIDELMK